jgi:hypothetical protein
MVCAILVAALARNCSLTSMPLRWISTSWLPWPAALVVPMSTPWGVDGVLVPGQMACADMFGGMFW